MGYASRHDYFSYFNHVLVFYFSYATYNITEKTDQRTTCHLYIIESLQDAL